MFFESLTFCCRIRAATSGRVPTARQDHSLVVVGSQIFLYGGASEAGLLGSVHVLELDQSDALREVSLLWGSPSSGGIMPPARAGHSATYWNGRVVIMFGYTQDGYSDRTWALDVDSYIWTKVRTAGTRPRGREGHSALLFRSRIFVFGGFAAGGCLDDMHVRVC